jgi:predicted ATPase/serine/threonine protein kinase
MGTGNSEEIVLPERIGPFIVRRFIGRGGMGVVYEAERESDGQRVAVKTVAVNSAALLGAIRVEVAALRQIQHPAVIRILEDGLAEGSPWYAMQILDGRPLAVVLRELWGDSTETARTRTTSGDTNDRVFRGAPEDIVPTASAPTGSIYPTSSSPRPGAAAGKLVEMLTLFRRLCEPLAFIHGQGMVHRDLKPENVFVLPNETVMLMDFGLVSYATGGIAREVLTSAPRGLGTAAYISPEQLRGQTTDARADLYSFGCMLYEAVTGTPPFFDRDHKRVIDRHLADPPTPASELVTGVPAPLDRILLRLLSKNPEERFGSADEIADALGRVLSGRAGTATTAGRRTALLQRPRIRGREDTLKELSALCDRVQSGRGTTVLVSGESGVGKTFVASELARRAHRRGLRVVVGGCSPPAGAADAGGAALHPLRGLFHAIADHCLEKGASVTRAILGEQGRYLLPFEPAFATVLGAVTDRTAEVDLPSLPARDRLLECLVGVVSRYIGTDGLVLLLDDLQWADELTLAFLAVVGRSLTESTPIIFIGTYRSEEMGHRLEPLVAVAEHRIRLTRLGVQDIEGVVLDMLAPETAPAPLAHFLAEVSEGNPFFAAEYLRFLVGGGFLQRARGRWELTAEASTTEALHTLPNPRSLTELIRRRLEVVSSGTRSLLEVASVLGREWDVDILAMVCNLPGREPISGLLEAMDREIIEKVTDHRFRFVHDKVREVSYADIPVQRRTSLHLSVAQSLESTGDTPAVEAERYSHLAHHYREAGNLEKALEYTDRAAQISLSRYAYGEATSLLNQALNLDAQLGFKMTPQKRAQWYRQLADAHQGLGQTTESESRLREAALAIGLPFPKSTIRMAFLLLGQVTRQIFHRLFARWRDSLRGAQPERLLEAARIHDRLQQISFFRGEGLPIFYAGIRALNLAETASPSIELAAAYANAHAVTGVVPLRALSESYYQQAVETLKRHGDPATESYLMTLHGIYRTGLGRWADAEAAFNRAAFLAEELKYRRRSEEVAGVQGVLAYFCGSFERAAECAERQHQSAIRGDSQTRCWGLLARAQVLLAWDRLDEAAADIRAAKELLPVLGRPEQIWAHGLLALTHLRQGAVAEAYGAAETALRRIAEAPPVAHYCIEAYSAVAETTIGLLHRGYVPPAGSPALVETAARRASRALRATARVFPIAWPRYWRALGLRRWSLSRKLSAVACWRKSLEYALSLQMPYDEAIARLLLSRSLHEGQGTDRAMHSGRAQQLFESLGVRWATDIVPDPAPGHPLVADASILASRNDRSRRTQR